MLVYAEAIPGFHFAASGLQNRLCEKRSNRERGLMKVLGRNPECLIYTSPPKALIKLACAMRCRD